MINDLGLGETEVLMLGLKAVIILDDGLARRVAEAVGLRSTGALGLLLDAKRAGYIPAIHPLLDQLHAIRFRVSPQTRQAFWGLAEEAE